MQGVLKRWTWRAGLAGGLMVAFSAAVSAPSDTANALGGITPDVDTSSTSLLEDSTDLAHIRAAFAAQFPEIALTGIAATPFPGLYELQIGRDLIYTNAQVTYLLQGSLIDVQSRLNLTEQRLLALNQVDFASLPLDLAIRQVQGSGKHQLVVFEDPNCRYCKLLHETLAQMDDVTIYTFLFPILSEDSAIKARDIWCAQDRAQTWQDWMRKGEVPATAQCDTPIPELLTLGRELRIRGTPALFFADGSQVSGALPLQALQEKFEQVETKQQEAKQQAATQGG